MLDERVLDLRQEEPSSHYPQIQKRFAGIRAGETMEAWFREKPGRVRMICLEAGLKYSLEEAPDHWKMRINGTDFHPLGMGMGIHSVVGEQTSNLLAACDRRETFYLIDPTGMRIAQRVIVGGTPSHVCMSPRGDRAMVANSEEGTVLSVRFDSALEKMEGQRRGDGEAGQTVTAGDSGVLSLAIGKGPHLPQFSPDGRYVCATGSISGDAAIIDALEERVLGIIPVGQGPHDPCFSADSQFAFVPVSERGDVAVIAMGREPRLVGRIPAGDGASHVSISPDGRMLYVANSYSADVTVCRIDGDLDQWKPEATIPSGAGAHVPELTPDGKVLLVANFLDDTITLIDTQQGKVKGIIPVGYYPHSFGITPDGRFAMVPCWGDEDIYLIDIEKASLVTRIRGGMGGSHVAFSPDGERAFIGNTLSDSLTVIDLPRLSQTATITGGRPVRRRGDAELYY